MKNKFFLKGSRPDLFLFLLSFGLFFSLFMEVSPAFSQLEITDDDVNRVASKLFCPTCEAVPVDVCPTQVCADWREEIRTQLSAGRSEEEILAYFANRYGEGVLANPPLRGFGLVVWIGPILIFLGGTLLFVRFLQNIRSPRAAETSPTNQKDTPENPYISRVEEELNQNP